jgi:hypothetical protein
MRARRRPPFSSGHLLRKRFPSKERKKIFVLAFVWKGRKKLQLLVVPKTNRKSIQNPGHQLSTTKTGLVAAVIKNKIIKKRNI